MSMNGGFPNGERASLLSGLRTHGPRMSAAQQQQQQQIEQMQQYQQLYLQQQQQQLYNQQNNPAQAQLFAFQQSQIELQLQQIQMANFALQDQILRQQQQAMQQQVQAQAQQQQQRQPSPPYANSRINNGQRSVSASPVVEQQQNKAVIWTGNEHDAAARQERWGALRNLQQARKQREGSPQTTATATPPSAAAAAVASGGNNDWQAERLRYMAPSSEHPATPPVVDKPTSSIVGTLERMASSGGGGHSKTASTASSASVQSLSISEAGECSPNKGPALVLSSPGDEFEEDEEEFPLHGGKEEPMSPTLNASIRAVNIHGRLAEAAKKESGTTTEEDGGGDKRKSNKKRHTLILSSSLPAFATRSSSSTAGDSGSASGSEDSSASSAGSLSPTTSEKSEVASFESSATNATSALATSSPTSASHPEPKEEEQEAEGKVAGAPTKKTMNAKAAVFNPTAASFTPGVITASTASETPAARYPASLSLRSQHTTPAATPPSMRVFTAPASVGSSFAGTPGNNTANNIGGLTTVLRQPKGPADESELGAKNFAGMIRRKAIGALRVATFSAGKRASPSSSPVVGGFPGDVHAFTQIGNAQFGGSPQMSVQSPTMSAAEGGGGAAGGAFAVFGADLAARALKRRSQQMQLGVVANPGLGMY